MLLAILHRKHDADYVYYIYHNCYKRYHSSHKERHLPYKESLKLDCFTSTKWPPDVARLIKIVIIIYHNYSGMTVKTVYLPTTRPRVVIDKTTTEYI